MNQESRSFLVLDGCLFGADRFVLSWISRLLNENLEKSVAIGAIDRQNRIIGGVAYNSLVSDRDGKPISLTATWAGNRGWLTKGRLSQFFRYPFVQVGVIRLTATVRKSNTRSLKITRKLGFKPEGLIRKGYGDGDAVIFGMLREECRWIK